MSATAGDDVRIVDEPGRQRYEARVGDVVAAFLEYRSVGTRTILVHTEVDASMEGRGIGGRLVAGALDDLRARGRRITVKCPFVAAFLERHPGYRDLVAGATGTSSQEQPA